MNNRARTAAEWVEIVSEMLTTYSRNPDDIIEFARSHGVIGGVYVKRIDARRIVGENGWTIEYDGTRFSLELFSALAAASHVDYPHSGGDLYDCPPCEAIMFQRGEISATEYATIQRERI